MIRGVSKPEEFLRKLAEAAEELKRDDPEAYEDMIQGVGARNEPADEEYGDMSTEEAFAVATARFTASMAFGPLREDLGRDGQGDRFELLTHYIRQREIPPEDAQLGAEQLGMTVEAFLERVRFMNERLEHHFRAAVAEMNDPEYVEEETRYLMSLLDKHIKPRDTH